MSSEAVHPEETQKPKRIPWEFLFQHSEPLCCISLFLMVCLWFGFWAHIGVDAHHDGVLLKPALDVAAGKMLFRDTFTQYGALTTLLQAWACMIFGPKLMVIRWLTVLFYAGSTVLVWRISRPLLQGWFRLIPVVLIFTQAPFYFWTFHSWSSVYALFFALLTCRLLQIGLNKKIGGGFWLLTGAVSILGFWCRQPLGLVFPAAVCVVFLAHWRFHENWLETLKKLMWFFVGAILISALFLFWIVRNHALIPFFHQSLEFAMNFVSQRSGSGGTSSGLAFYAYYKVLRSIFKVIFLRNVFYGAISFLTAGWFFFLVGKFMRHKNFNLISWQLLPVVLISGISLHQYYPVPCIRHYYWAAFPAFLLCGWSVQYWLCAASETCGFRVKRALGVALLCLFAGWTCWNYATNDRRFSTMKSTYEISELSVYGRPGLLQGVWMVPWEVKFWDDFYAGVERIPEPQRNAPVVNATFNAFYQLLFPNQTNWHPMYVNWGNSVDPMYSDKMFLAIFEGKYNTIELFPMLKKGKDGTYVEISEEETIQGGEQQRRQIMFQIAKLLNPEKEIVEFPEYKCYGLAACHTVDKGKYAVLILSPTGKMIQYSAKEEMIEDEKTAKNLKGELFLE